MANIRWTQEAATWLEDIFEFIAQDNPQAASRVVSAIYEKLNYSKPSLLLDTSTDPSQKAILEF